MAGYLYHQEKRNCPPRLITTSPFRTKTIISYGLMVQAEDTQRWLIVQRKHTIEFILLLQGNYRYSHLPSLIVHLTSSEQEQLRTILDLEYDDYCHYCQNLGIESKSHEYGYQNLEQNRLTLQLLLVNVTKSGQLTWSWPKGRCEWREKPFSCACREFEEEIEKELPPALKIESPMYIFRQNTLLGREIEGRFWLYRIEKEFSLSPPTNNEVSSIKWVNTSELKEYLGYEPLEVCIPVEEIFLDQKTKSTSQKSIFLQ